MDIPSPRFRAIISALLLAPMLHPILRPFVGVPSHLLWFVHVLPVAWWTYHRGPRIGGLAIAASIGAIMAGERAFGAGYFVSADWPTALSLAVSVGLTSGLVAGFASYARRASALERQLWHAQKLESLGLFAGSIAHDFNNVLTAISLGSEAALDTLSPDHPSRREVVEVIRSSRRGALLTKQLLAFARRDEVRPQTVAIRDVVERLDAMLRHLIGRNVALTVRLKHAVAAYCDPGHVEQMLTNLVVNANDAMPEGGALTIELSRVAPGHVLIPRGAAVKTDYAMLSVADSGIGMSESVRSRIFEPLFTTKPPGKGTGLGLSTVRQLAEHWKGHVTVSSTPGHGSTFRVFLPVAAGDDETTASAPTTALGRLASEPSQAHAVAGSSIEVGNGLD